MPSVDVEGPPIDIEKKRELVAEVTKALKRAYKEFGFIDDTMIVRIKENQPQNVGIGGILVIDRQKQVKN
jgi:4-oxalocrotonate tautomerase family enzyme